MNKSLRLSIPTPCTEDWAKMLPAERGRHCEQCCKTVVDFTGMSDEEVVRFFTERVRGTGPGGADKAGSGGTEKSGSGRAGKAGSGGESGVCGRFASDQLGRRLAPAPVQRNGWKGWQLVVASALVMGKGTGPARPVKPGVEMGQVGSAALAQVEMGEPLIRPDTSRMVLLGDTTMIRDTSGVDMGAPMVIVGDDMAKMMLADTVETMPPDAVEMLPADTVEMLPPDTVKAWPLEKDRELTGVVAIIPDSPVLTRPSRDTASAVKVVVDTVVNFLKDTVAAVIPAAFGSDELVRVYPNPVVRGGVMRVQWNTAGGRYQVALVSAGGALVQERVVDIGGKGQLSEWALPNGLTAGVYFLRIARSGERVFTKEVVVQ